MEQKLHPNVIPYWRIMHALGMVKWVAIGSIPLVVRLIWLPAWTWLTVVSGLTVSFFLLRGLFFIGFGVHIKYSRLSYQLGDDEIRIRWGHVWSDNSSVIPFSRVQHADLEQNALAKKLGISALTIATAGDHHAIPGLAEEEAVRLRRRIIDLAKLDDREAYDD